MLYKKRPAWRNQWLAMVVAALILWGDYLIGKEYIDFSDYTTAATALAPFFIPFLLVCLFMCYQRYSWRYTIDSKTIESKHGIVARDLRSIRVEDVRSINVRQSLMQRLLFTGDVEVSSSGTGGVEVIFFGVGNPIRVKEDIQRQLG